MTTRVRVVTHKEKITWMAMWCAKNEFQLVLKGECGFGRPCVGITSGDLYPDYEWRDNKDNDSLPFEERWKRTDENGEVWCPPNAHHKHPCVAVLGRGRFAEEQLYEWLRWFDQHKFKKVVGTNPAYTKALKEGDTVLIVLTPPATVRLVRQKKGGKRSEA